MAESNIGVKLLAVQKEIGTVTKGAVNPFYSSKYVEINSLLAAISPILQKHGVLLSQPLTSIEGKPALTTSLQDVESGTHLSSTTPIPDIQDPQKMGAAITYFRRYGILSVLGLGAVDDDAQSTSGKKKAPAKSKAPAKAKSINNLW
jgi:hypothetical protein